MAENRQPSLDPERQLIVNSLFSDGIEDPASPSMTRLFFTCVIITKYTLNVLLFLLAHSSGTESLITYCKVSEDAGSGGGGNSPKMNPKVDVKIRYLLVTSKF